MTSTIQVLTLGCSKNTVDTEHLLASLPSDRFMVIPEGEDVAVDYLLINTCGFIGDAKEESVNAILAAALRKKEGLVRTLYVFGCLSQRYRDELPGLIPEVDGWFGARDLGDLLRALGVEPSVKPSRRRTVPGMPYAFLKISEGCDRRCSYCAIPYIRGNHRSVPVEALVAAASELASQGDKELVLIAQDTTWYGLDLYGRKALADLLKALSEVAGIEWLGIHYSYPSAFPEDVLEQMVVNPKTCKYLDIPLQHVSTRVLGNMHRGIDARKTRDIIRRVRETVPGVVLRTTMMVGFPGEDSKEFRSLLDFVREARFERLGAFTYSEEEGTWGAENLRDSIRPSTKKLRLDALMQLQREISLEFNTSRIGSEEKVLVDSYTDGVLVCRSQYESPEVDGEILVSCPDAARAATLVGQFVNVRITAADDYDLTADLIATV